MDWLEVEWKGTRLQDNSVQLTKELLCKVIKRVVSVQKIIHLPLPPLCFCFCFCFSFCFINR